MTRTALLFSSLIVVGGATTALAQPSTRRRPAAPLLERGASGDQVRILQHLIRDAQRQLKLSPKIAIDGDFGRKTEGFLKQLQRLVGAPVTGKADRMTWYALRKIAARGPLGRLDPLAPATRDRYRRKTKGSSDVSIHPQPAIEITRGKRATPLMFESKLAVDADGDGDAWKSDPWGQPTTSLTYPGTRKALDPTKIPYFVLPIGFEKQHPGVKLGDIAAVIHDGKVSYAIYGDRGPRGKIGEASIKVAQELGIDADPKSGGLSEGGVFYIVFPGSGSGRPLTPAEIRRRGQALLKKAGGRPPAKPQPARRRSSRVSHAPEDRARRGIVHGLADLSD